MLTEKELAARIDRVTSSSIAAIVGLDPYTTLRQVKAKIRGYSTFKGNRYTNRGNWLEDPVLLEQARRLGLRYEKPGFKTVGDKFGASADAIYYDGNKPVLLGEAKTVGSRASQKWGEPGTDQVPANVACQCYWMMLHYPEFDRVLVSMFGGHDLFIEEYSVEYSESSIEYLVKAGKEFHRQYIELDETPPIQPGDEQDIKEAYPKAEKELVVDNEGVSKIMSELRRSTRLEKEFKDKNSVLKSQVRELLGAHEGATGVDYKVTWNNAKDRAKIDWQAIAGELKCNDELVKKHTTMVPGSRVLRLNFK